MCLWWGNQLAPNHTNVAVCSSLHCRTRYLIAVLARPTAQVPHWAGNVSGGPGSIPGQFWRTGLPSFRRCSAEPLHSNSVKYREVVRPLHRPLHYWVRGWGRLKNKTITNICKIPSFCRAILLLVFIKPVSNLAT